MDLRRQPQSFSVPALRQATVLGSACTQPFVVAATVVVSHDTSAVAPVGSVAHSDSSTVGQHPPRQLLADADV